MSTAPAAADAPAPAKGGSKKLIIIIAAVVLLLVVGGVVAFLLLKKPAHADEEGADGAPAAHTEASKPKPKAHAARDPKHPPTYVPLDPFTVNLADHDADRYAQVSVTLELDDAKVGDEIKAFMPAVRNNILLVLSHKTAKELLELEGKSKLAEEIRRETARALGIEVEDPDEGEDADAEEPKKSKKKKKKKVETYLPVTAVYFSNFIIQ